jgi:hypothetical protein
MGKQDSSSITDTQPSPSSPLENIELKTDAPEPTADELGRLRDILFGSQSRTLEKRLSDLETGLRSLRQELTNLVQDQISALSESTSGQFVETRREFNEKLDKQGTDQSTQLRAVQKDLIEKLDNLESFAADVLRQLRETHKELSDRLDKQAAEQTERTRNLQSEARQRDDSLRQELLSMAASLDNKKASRQDLGQMLMELGLRLRQESEKS